MGKKLGDKGYLTIVRDLKSRAILHVGKGKSGECLDECGMNLKRANSKLKYVVVDLAPSFTSWIKKTSLKPQSITITFMLTSSLMTK